MNNTDRLLDLLCAGVVTKAELTINLNIDPAEAVDITDRGKSKVDARFKMLAENLNKLQSQVLVLARNQSAEIEEPTKPAKKKKKNKTSRVQVRKNLTQAEVWRVRRLLKEGRKPCWIRRQMNLASSTVSQIQTGTSYRHIPEEPAKKPTVVRPGVGVIK